jgi:type VI secretion system secreted protein Hcp
MAAVDYFLKIEGIQGESASQKHKGEIEILSWSWGESQTGGFSSSGGAGAGKVQVGPFHFAAHSSLASPKLFLACASGQHFQKAVLTATRQAKGKAQDYLVWTLTDVLVTSFQTGADNPDALPVDGFDLDFGKIEVDYKPIKADGSLGASVKAGWDVKANKAV